MRKITARIVHFFIESKVIDETDQEIYEYNFENKTTTKIANVNSLSYIIWSCDWERRRNRYFFVLVLLVKKVLRWIPCKNKARMSYSHIYYLYSISY